MVSPPDPSSTVNGPTQACSIVVSKGPLLLVAPLNHATLLPEGAHGNRSRARAGDRVILTTLERERKSRDVNPMADGVMAALELPGERLARVLWGLAVG